jgi:hypothetical protein
MRALLSDKFSRLTAVLSVMTLEIAWNLLMKVK